MKSLYKWEEGTGANVQEEGRTGRDERRRQKEKRVKEKEEKKEKKKGAR